MLDPEKLNEALNEWPPGSIGYDRTRHLIEVLSLLGEAYGYGYVPQVAIWIDDLFRHPDRLEKYQRDTEARRNLLMSTVIPPEEI